MSAADGGFPVFPPGFHRRIVLLPGAGWVGGALEDDMHRFLVRLDHADRRIVRVEAKAVRHPWSACPGAAHFIASELTGELLADTAMRDPFQHCTHLLDLAVLAASHAGDRDPTRFDMFVADPLGTRATAALLENGTERLRWQLDGTVIAGTGRDLRQLSEWKQELPPRKAEWATVLRRAVFVSDARRYVPPPDNPTAAENDRRMGVCFNYRLPQAATSRRTPDWRRDFSTSGREPLEDLDPVREFETMRER